MSYAICINCGALCNVKGGEGGYVLRDGKDAFRCGRCMDEYEEGRQQEYQEMREESRRENEDHRLDDPRHGQGGR
jgi:hypothetical protein